MDGTRRYLNLAVSAFLLVFLLFGCSTTALVDTSPDSVPEGFNRVVFYWQGNADIASSDMWIWWSGKDGSGYLFEECQYGFKCSVDVPVGVAKIGFIVRTSCSEPGGSSWGSAVKDYADDRFAYVRDGVSEVYLKTGDGLQYTSSDGGETLEPVRFFLLASMEDYDRVGWSVSPSVDLDDINAFKIKDMNGDYMEIESVNADGTIKLKGEMDICGKYTLEIDGYGEKEIVPNGIFDTERFNAEYTYDGDDLGSVIKGERTVFKVWAPTAQSVVLNLFEDGEKGEAYLSFEMTKAEKGVWTAEAECGHGTYYTYTVTTALGTSEAVDPYARTTGVNGNRGMVVDSALTNPDGYENDTYIDTISSYSDAVVWETHVRDFSIENEASSYRGKYLAFTETGLVNSSGFPTGVDYIKALGITHVQLMPVFDYATVDEKNPDASYNWGYDPKNYNVPEGSYSTDPYHGEVRIKEFKEMVQSLHENGIGVVMDVVYNHTYDSDSSLNRIVPYYYYRYTPDGTNSNGSGCGNETASERPMFRKFMIDSLTYWMREYHLDGFRFDLMGIHDIETMAEIEKALHAVNPECLIYGEGWSGGSCAYPSSLLASQANFSKIKASAGASGSIAVFNDVTRDGLKGSVFTSSGKGFISGAVTKDNAEKTAFGIKGGSSSSSSSWSVKNAMVVNYMSAHDNNTLWDKLELSNPENSEEERAAMNRLGAAVIMISRGMPFMLSGEEIMRTKGGNENSYKSPDSVNAIDWESIKSGSGEEDMFSWYKNLIEMRKKYSWLRNGDVTTTIWDNNSIFVTYRVRGNIAGIAIVNACGESFLGTLPPGTWKVILDGDDFVNESRTAESCVSVPGYGVILLCR